MEISTKKSESEFTELRDKIAEAEREIAALSAKSGTTAGGSSAGAAGGPGSSR